MKQLKEMATASLGIALAVSIPLIALMYHRAQNRKRDTSEETSIGVKNDQADGLNEQYQERTRSATIPKTMPLLFELPDPLIREVLFSWVAFDDLSRLDKAVCNQRARLQMHAVFESPNLAQHVSEDAQRSLDILNQLLPMYCWAVKRGMRFDGLVLSSVSAVEIAQKSLFGEHVRWVHFRVPSSDSHCYFVQVLTGCHNLRTLVVNANLNQNSAVLISTNCALLKHLDVSDARLFMTDVILQLVCKGCPELTYLDVGRSHWVSERGFAQGLALLKGLRHIPGMPLDASTLVTLSRSCPLLETFHAVFPTAVHTEADLLRFARRFPRVTSMDQLLRMPLPRSLLSRATYLELFLVCPRITAWEIPAGLGMEDVKAVLALHDQLTALSVDITRSNDILGVIARRCPQLQQLTVRVDEYTGPLPRELDTALMIIASACPSLHTLAFATARTMTADGIFRFTLRCPSLRHVILQRQSPRLMVKQRVKLMSLVPGLVFTAEF